jgi:hypothetical protein
MTWMLALGLACGRPEGIVIEDRVVGAACGTCVFHMDTLPTRPSDVPVKGCFWAVDIDGTFYPAAGVVPPDDAKTAHAPDGMCSVERKATVAGRITPDGRFVATRFELLPDDGTGRQGEEHAH